ncbi:FecR family protein [Emticicia sp. BO119]|uniref:FecR family protein n=1 Tax=Emticicia sp. BO119 TaxID=2757768 RepID=UPI0015F1067C|nr:FecR family protein [Emticicia sp. BO119]MBA4851409.1 FecR family protein [Emticicia sp. BO119]
MNRQSFALLLNKYLNGQCTAAEQKVVEQWYDLLDETPTAEWNAAELEEQLWQKIRKHTRGEWLQPTDVQRTFSIFHNRNRMVTIAASVLLVFGVVLAFYFKRNIEPSVAVHTPASLEGMMQTTNSTGKAMKIALEDGSQVTLQPQSKLHYPEKFGELSREVYLEGEGFFEVQKNPAKPFFVYTGNVTTKVLGTSFYVKSIDGIKKIEVEVVSGRVSVYEKENSSLSKDNQTNGVVLTPNHKVTFFAESNLFVTNIVRNPVIQTPKIQDTKVFFEFDDTPVLAVLNKLREAYGVDILVENEAINNCLLTADITHQTLYTKLDIICAAIGATYEVKGTTILLSGMGCK